MFLKDGIEAGHHGIERPALALLPGCWHPFAPGPDHQDAQQPHGREQRDRDHGAVNNGVEQALAFQRLGPEVRE